MVDAIRSGIATFGSFYYKCKTGIGAAAERSRYSRKHYTLPRLMSPTRDKSTVYCVQ